MNLVRRTFRLIFNRRVGWALLCVLLLVAIAVAINLIGIRVVGGVNGWTQWLKDHSGHFFVWRLCIYGLTAYGWWRMRKRILARESGTEPVARLSRAELSAVLTIVALEAATFMQAR